MIASQEHDRSFRTAQQHAIDRFGEGFDVASVVTELAILRECILRVWRRERPRAVLVLPRAR